jgi:hypothetical protein
MLKPSFPLLVTNFKTFIGITEYMFYTLAISGLFALRRRHHLLRPAELSDPDTDSSMENTGYRTWTFNPLIFSALSSALVLRGLLINPRLAMAASMAYFGGGWIVCHAFGMLKEEEELEATGVVSEEEIVEGRLEEAAAGSDEDNIVRNNVV